MRRLLLALLIALPALAAGCTTPTATPGETDLAATGSEGAPDEAAPAPAANGSSGGAAGAPAPTQSDTNASRESAPPAPGEPTAPRPADFQDHQEGWVPPPAGAAPFGVDLALPVEAGAVNATVKVELATLVANATRAPREAGTLSVEVRDPEGNLVAAGNRSVQSDPPYVLLELGAFAATGNHVVAIRITGLGDGQSLGMRWLADLYVAY